MKPLFGAMEGGGTKFACLVGISPDEIVEMTSIPTTSPLETLDRVIAFFRKYDLSAIGLAPFGPLDLDKTSPGYGSITATPKAGWAQTNIMGAFRQAFNLPLALEVDVNAAVFGEHTWVEANQGLDSMVYITVGTGIGAGILLSGRLVHGLSHPEAGHVHLPHDWALDPFPGCCPFHQDCLEGLASGTAIAQRWQLPAEQLDPAHPAWDLEASYLAQAVANLVLSISPQRIILGGGVMRQKHLFPAIRRKVFNLLNGYVHPLSELASLDQVIVPPRLGQKAGVLGALALAIEAI